MIQHIPLYLSHGSTSGQRHGIHHDGFYWKKQWKYTHTHIKQADTLVWILPVGSNFIERKGETRPCPVKSQTMDTHHSAVRDGRPASPLQKLTQASPQCST